jgi:xanthine/uracil permease
MTMAETHPRPTEETTSPRRRHLRRGITHRIIGVVYLAIAAAGVIFALVTWWLGRLTPINLLVFALTVFTTTPIGLLALRGDALGSRWMDEGQQDMDRAAKADAFYVAYLGLFCLFIATILSPGFRDALPVATGLLLLGVSLTWVGGYMWRRWRP